MTTADELMAFYRRFGLGDGDRSTMAVPRYVRELLKMADADVARLREIDRLGAIHGPRLQQRLELSVIRHRAWMEIQRRQRAETTDDGVSR